jgi:hypothetical protein
VVSSEQNERFTSGTTCALYTKSFVQKGQWTKGSGRDFINSNFLNELYIDYFEDFFYDYFEPVIDFFFRKMHMVSAGSLLYM